MLLLMLLLMLSKASQKFGAEPPGTWPSAAAGAAVDPPTVGRWYRVVAGAQGRTGINQVAPESTENSFFLVVDAIC